MKKNKSRYVNKVESSYRQLIKEELKIQVPKQQASGSK